MHRVSKKQIDITDQSLPDTKPLTMPMDILSKGMILQSFNSTHKIILDEAQIMNSCLIMDSLTPRLLKL